MNSNTMSEDDLFLLYEIISTAVQNQFDQHAIFPQKLNADLIERVLDEIKEVFCKSHHILVDEKYIELAISLFCKNTQVSTLLKFIKMRQLEIAANLLLRNKFLKIKTVAYQSGYKNSGDFSEIFKRYMGITPSAYRKKYLENFSPQNS